LSGMLGQVTERAHFSARSQSKGYLSDTAFWGSEQVTFRLPFGLPAWNASACKGFFAAHSMTRGWKKGDGMKGLR